MVDPVLVMNLRVSLQSSLVRERVIVSAYPVAAGADAGGYVAALISRGILNDQRAFVELDAMFRPTIVDFLRSSCGDRCLADELANETFLRAYRSLSGFRGQGRQQFRSFLFTISNNLLKDHYRGRKPLQSTTLEAQDDSLAQLGDSSAEKPLETQERAQMLRRALASLEPGQAKLIRLAHLKDLKAEQIADMLGKPSAQAVRAALSRAMKDLKATLQRQGYFDQVSA